MKIDLDRRRITVSVGDIVHEGSAAAELGPGIFTRARGQLGSKMHRAHQALMKARHETYQAEVPLVFEQTIAGYEAKILGRIDGIYDEAGTVIVEEIKSSLLPEDRLRAGGLGSFPAYALQLRLYLLFLTHGAQERPVTGRLVMLPAAGGDPVVFDLPPDNTGAWRDLETRLAAIIRRAEEMGERHAQQLAYARTLAFPYPDPRPAQVAMMRDLAQAFGAGKQALVHAPTGVGKTAGALFPALKHALETGRRTFFATAKRTQQELVVRTLSDMLEAAQPPRADPPLRAVTLRAKERMCPPQTLTCHPEHCEFLRDLEVRAANPKLQAALDAQPILGPDRTFAIGQQFHICPFELQLRAAGQADVIIGDYNYVFDPRVALRELLEESGARYLLVIDEAHNLPARAAEYYSPSLSQREFAALAAGLRGGTLMPDAETGARGLFDGYRRQDPRRIRDAIAEACEEIVELVTDALHSAPDPGHHLKFEVTADVERITALRDHLEPVMLNYFLWRLSRAEPIKDDPLATAYFQVLRFADVAAEAGDDFVFYIEKVPARREFPEDTRLRILCLNPASRLRRRLAAFDAAAAMSATLQPLFYYRDVLGFAADAPLFSYGSSFPPQNRAVLVVPWISTLYRDRDRHLADIAGVIDSTIAARPGNYMVFFPSFDFLYRTSPLVKAPGFRILRQGRDMGDDLRSAILQRFRRSREPNLLLAVQGGIFSEGVDLPGEALIGAIVVGPGLPEVGFEREYLRGYHEQAHGAGFDYAYLYPGMNRVVQSAGRVIRTPSDEGIIVLVCRRFATPKYQSLFPQEWLESGIRYTDDPGQAAREFWGRAKGR